MTAPIRCLSALLVLSLVAVAQEPAAARTDMADRVVVIRNASSPISQAVADDYVQRRGVQNVLTIKCQDATAGAHAETIPFAAYQKDIEAPLRAFLASHPVIDFIVLTKGIPIRLADAPQGPRTGRVALDSYLAALDYDKIPGAIRIDISDPNYGRDFHGLAWANRFWKSTDAFSHARFGGFLVSRLDGYTEADAKALVTRSLAAEQAVRSGKKPEGSILLDECPGFGFTDKAKQPYSILPVKLATGEMVRITAESKYGEFNSDMQLAAELLKARNFPVELETTDRFAGNRTGLMGYVSWGSNDQKFDAGAYHSLGFAAGALAETAVSTSARTFLPTQGGQSLIADLIAQGGTGVKGYTDEPLLQAIASPSIMFDRYTRGWTAVESLYAASSLVGWQDIVIGDPLCRAYPVISK
ncbi:MAG: TIGR03790 family protein [Planctomycetota bacterium]